MVEAARTGNPFIEKNLLIARVDQPARSDELVAKLGVSDWDLVIVDEAHKMSARLYGNEVDKTKRFQLGEVPERTRNLLLLTATPQQTARTRTSCCSCRCSIPRTIRWSAPSRRQGP